MQAAQIVIALICIALTGVVLLNLVAAILFSGDASLTYKMSIADDISFLEKALSNSGWHHPYHRTFHEEALRDLRVGKDSFEKAFCDASYYFPAYRYVQHMLSTRFALLRAHVDSYMLRNGIPR